MPGSRNASALVPWAAAMLTMSLATTDAGGHGTAPAIADPAPMLLAQTTRERGDKPFLAPMNATSEPASQSQNSPSSTLPPLGGAGSTVERGELQPVMANDGSGLPYELWRGLDAEALEALFASLDIPPRSEALFRLWHRLITADVTPLAGGARNSRFDALRVEALHRSGLLDAVVAALDRGPDAAGDPVIALLAARSKIGLGDSEGGCALIRTVVGARSTMPRSLRGEAALQTGFCAAARGDTAGAGLAAELAREEGLTTGQSLAILDAIALGAKPQPDAKQMLSLLDYRLLQLAGVPTTPDMITKAQPALLAALARERGLAPGLRLAAAETAARANILTTEGLATAYREVGRPQAGTNAVVAGAATDSAIHRAILFATFESERTPQQKVRQMRAFLDSARRSALYLPALMLVAKASETLVPVPEIGWFSETAIEAALAARDYARARIWVTFAQSLDGGQGNRLDHWLALADIAENTGGDGSLGSVEQMALGGRFGSDQLHRLATVLDALDTRVPIPLWEAASRTPQPSGGHLPPTGVLSELQDAAKKREFGRTVLLAMQTLGPDGAEGAHMIALGDAIRALKRAGLEQDARRIAFEALFATWPRSITN